MLLTIWSVVLTGAALALAGVQIVFTVIALEILTTHERITVRPGYPRVERIIAELFDYPERRMAVVWGMVTISALLALMVAILASATMTHWRKRHWMELILGWPSTLAILLSIVWYGVAPDAWLFGNRYIVLLAFAQILGLAVGAIMGRHILRPLARTIFPEQVRTTVLWLLRTNH